MGHQPIIIVGFMGSGKTTVAFEVGRKLNLMVVDLDDLITRVKGRTPAEIIEKDGEDSFREVETQMLRDVLAEKSPVVIAAGGGAWTIAQNRRLIGDHEGRTLWLDAPFELCWKRIQANRELRPLARSLQEAQRLYEERRPIYQLADLRIPVADNDSAAEIAERLIDGLTINCWWLDRR
jgi:shikimate kinase